jgi:hypothetical protein
MLIQMTETARSLQSLEGYEIEVVCGCFAKHHPNASILFAGLGDVVERRTDTFELEDPQLYGPVDRIAIKVGVEFVLLVRFNDVFVYVTKIDPLLLLDQEPVTVH